MVYVKEIDLWVGYLQSGLSVYGALTTASVYGATVTDTRPWADHAEDLFRVSKRMPTIFALFCRAFKPENSFWRGNPNKTLAVDTASRRMI